MPSKVHKERTLLPGPLQFVQLYAVRLRKVDAIAEVGNLRLLDEVVAPQL